MNIYPGGIPRNAEKNVGTSCFKANPASAPLKGSLGQPRPIECNDSIAGIVEASEDGENEGVHDCRISRAKNDE